MTKCIVLGEKPKETPSQKKIKLDRFLSGPSSNPKLEKSSDIAQAYEYLELVTKGYFGDTDLIFAYDDPEHRTNGILYLGQWNDGVV